MYIDLVWEFIAYYNVANLVVIATKMDMIDQMACGKYNWGTNTAVSIKTPTELCRGLFNYSHSLPQTSTDGLSWSWSLPHTLAESSTAPNFDYPVNHVTVHHQSNCKTGGGLKYTCQCSCSIRELFAYYQRNLGHLHGLRSTGEVSWKLYEKCMWLLEYI
jgi:hypothetical protein